ncbi:dihydrodipicolinate synthase family protein [Planctomycetota bacterium]
MTDPESLRQDQIDPEGMIVRRRKILGISAVLLPYQDRHEVDWPAFDGQVLRTVEAGLIPAVNMDTGYVNLLDEATRIKVLERTEKLLAGGKYAAGAYVADGPGAPWNPDAYHRQIELIQSRGGTAVIFQSFGLTQQANAEIVGAYQVLGQYCQEYIAFELGRMFAPFGKIYDLETYGQIMAIPQCVGAKHSSLDRELEWRRLRLRNRQRLDFKVFTGNDTAIDMVMYGSDYLLGLSTFAPDAFALRDKFWQEGDRRFYPLNDLLQYLGFFAFRDPVPAYKHSAAQFLKLRGWITSATPHPDNPRRPDSDIAVLENILERLKVYFRTFS